jgi:hypothetical protein
MGMAIAAGLLAILKLLPSNILHGLYWLIAAAAVLTVIGRSALFKKKRDARSP